MAIVLDAAFVIVVWLGEICMAPKDENDAAAESISFKLLGWPKLVVTETSTVPVAEVKLENVGVIL